MAPFANDDAVFQEQQSWIASYDGFERDRIGVAELIFGTGEVGPSADGIVTTGCETVEVIAVILTVFVQLVDGAKVAVAGFLKRWRNQQKRITGVAKNFFGNVLAIVHSLYDEIVNGWHIAFAGHHRLAVDECPCGVRIVFQCELLLLSVFLQDKCGLKLWRLLSFWYLHAFVYIGSDVIGPEVEDRQVVQA